MKRVIPITNFFKNQTVVTLTSANIFETLGVSLFNIVLLTYAKGFKQANLFVSIASVASILPGTIGVLMGHLADNTGKKANALIFAKIVQAVLYIILANLITSRTSIIFGVVILINIVSDLVGTYSWGLRASIIQGRVPRSLQRTVLGISQSIAMFLQPIGQSIGIMVLSYTHSYAMAGYINALTFLIAAIALYIGKDSIQLPHSIEGVIQGRSDSFRVVMKQMGSVLKSATKINVPLLMVSIMVLNALAAGMGVIINLTLLKTSVSIHLSYGETVLLVNVFNIVGVIIGSLVNTKLTAKMSVRTILSFADSCLMLLFLNLWFIHSFLLILVPYFLLGWGIGQFNPKLDSEVMKLADSHIIGIVSGAIVSIATIASPVGSIGLVLLYNLVPNWLLMVSQLVY